MSEQTAPLPLFILAVAFLLVWNMEPVSEESSEPDYVEMNYESHPTDRAQPSASDTDQGNSTSQEEDLESEESETQQGN